MKKTLIALAVLGAAAGTAYAQSNVTIYGVVDTGYVKKTGVDTEMDENVNSRIGFKGVEDLGDGLKATFQLEKRMDVAKGTIKGVEWEGNSNVGLKHDDWGAVRLGRMNGILTENIRKFDPFYQYGVGGMIDSTQRGVRRSNMLRYDSPDWAGFSFSAAYELGRNMNDRSRDIDGTYIRNSTWEPDKGLSNGYDNDGYQIGLNYKYGGFAATADYQVLADSNRSHVWGVGLSYSWDTVKVEALYQDTLDKTGYLTKSYTENVLGWTLPGKYDGALDSDVVASTSVKEQQALLGVEWKVGPGRLNASAQWLGIEGKGVLSNLDEDAWKVAVGYTYNLSKRTSLYGIVAYTDWGSEEVGAFMDGVDQDSTTAVQLGITHKF